MRWQRTSTPPPCQFCLIKRSEFASNGSSPRAERSDPAIGLLFGYYPKKVRQKLDKSGKLLNPNSPEYKTQQLIYLRNHALLLALYSTAGRAAEVAALDRHDVAEGNATQVNVLGKGKKERESYPH